VGFIATKNVS